MKFHIDRDVSFALTPDAERYGTRISQPCSPDIQEGAGVAINAPREVVFSRGPTLRPDDVAFIVCGATQFQQGALGAAHVSLVAVDARTHESFSAPVQGDLSVVPAEAPPDLLAPETDHSRTMIGKYFRANLAGIMQLPARETEYTVYAVLGPYRSNALTVKVVKSRTP